MGSPWPALMGYSEVLQNTVLLFVPWQSCVTWLLILYLNTPPSSFPSSHPCKACGLCGEDIGTCHVWPLLTQVFLEIPSDICQHL